MATNQSTPESSAAPAVAANVTISFPAAKVVRSRMRGIVQGWDAEDGYGFVRPPKEVDCPALLKRHQVEAAGLLDILQDDMTLDYELVESDVGPVAGNLRLVTTQP